MKKRTVAFIAHGGSGKTSITESILHKAGVTKRQGKVEDGTTISDYAEDEVKRKISIRSSLIHCQWKGNALNLIDTPGYADFAGEVVGSLRVVDGAVIIVSAQSGIEVGTEKVWKYADDEKLPRLIFVNKMDGEDISFLPLLERAKRTWGKRVMALQLPIEEGSGFCGVIDLLSMKAYIYQQGSCKEGEIPADIASVAEEHQKELIEHIAELDDELLEKYIEGENLSPDELKRGLRSGTLKGEIIPVLVGSALREIGITEMLDAIVEFLPSPDEGAPLRGKGNGEDEVLRLRGEDEPFTALVFKTLFEPHLGSLSLFRVYSGSLSPGTPVFNATKGAEEKIGQILTLQGKEKEEVEKVAPGDLVAVAKLKETSTGDTLCSQKAPIILPPVEFPEPVISIAIKPKAKKDQEKLMTAMAKIKEEDKTFATRIDHELSQTIISGLGELHLEIIIDELRNKFGVDLDIEKAKVAYRETITGKARVQGKFKRQSGGRGQYGDVWVRIEPLERGEGFEFVNEIVGGAIPAKYVPAVEKGVKEAIQKGVLANYPTVDLRVTLDDGTFHKVDSSDMAFQIAGSLAVKKALLEATPVLLEPIMNVEVVIPDEYLGNITGDLNERRGRIMGTEPRGSAQLINAMVPLSDMDHYSTDLRSMTKGTGSYQMKLSHYEKVPSHISEKIIAAAKEADN